jgi:hypothetical protein
MSRSGERLEQFSEAAGKRRSKAGPPEAWTWREKASVWGSLAALGVLALIPFADQSIKYHRSIEQRLENWKTDYHLSNETVEKLRVIELAYHDFESPLSTARQPLASEAEAHGQEIAKHLAPEHARVFLEREAANHEKHRGNDR